MKCPVCVTTDLRVSDRQGIEIDYCPQCRGIWLDRGELDKIIDRSTVALNSQESDIDLDWDHQLPEKPKRGNHRPELRNYQENPPPKKRTFLSELFDILD